MKNTKEQSIKKVILKKCFFYYEFENLMKELFTITSSFIMKFIRHDSFIRYDSLKYESQTQTQSQIISSVKIISSLNIILSFEDIELNWNSNEDVDWIEDDNLTEFDTSIIINTNTHSLILKKSVKRERKQSSKRSINVNSNNENSIKRTRKNRSVENVMMKV
jgi:hypothetical protein